MLLQSVLQASSLSLPDPLDRAAPGLGRTDGLPSGSCLFQTAKEFQTPSEKRHHRMRFPMGKDMGSSTPAPGRHTHRHRRGKDSSLYYKYFSSVSRKSPAVSARQGEELEPIRDHILPEEGRPARQRIPTGPRDHLGRKLFLTAFQAAAGH